MEKIIHLFYSIESGTRPERVQTERLIGMRAELASWRSALPVNLRIDSISPIWAAQAPCHARARVHPTSSRSMHSTMRSPSCSIAVSPAWSSAQRRSGDWSIRLEGVRRCGLEHLEPHESLPPDGQHEGAPQLISYINFCAAGIHVRLAAQLQQRAPTAGSEMRRMWPRRAAGTSTRRCVSVCRTLKIIRIPTRRVVKAKSVIRNMAERAGILDLLNAADEEGGLSPVGQGDSPPMHLSGAGNGASNGRNGHEAGGALLGSGGGMDVTHSSAQNTGTVVDSPREQQACWDARAAPLAQPSTFGVTPPYEIDFESILASFDQFEAAGRTGQDGLFAGNSDAPPTRTSYSDSCATMILLTLVRTQYEPFAPTRHRSESGDVKAARMDVKHAL